MPSHTQIALVICAHIALVHGHGNLEYPKVVGDNLKLYYHTAKIDGLTNSQTQVEDIRKILEEKKMTLVEFAKSVSKKDVCITSDLSKTLSLSASVDTAEFVSNLGTGLSHQGPIQMFVNHKLAFTSDNAEKHFKADPKSGHTFLKPVNYKLCAVGETCLFQFVWFAFQNEDTQIYVSCAMFQLVDGTSDKQTPTSLGGEVQPPKRKSKKCRKHKV